MLRHYLTMTLAVLKRGRSTPRSAFRHQFTLLVLMVVTAMADHALAPMPPESRQAACSASTPPRWGAEPHLEQRAGYLLFDRYARKLPGVEELTLFTSFQTVSTYLGDQRVSSALKRTDAAFWRVFDFTFIEGDPYTEADVAEARFVAVITRASRERLFAGQPALGKTFEADGQAFRVVGVVANGPTPDDAVRRVFAPSRPPNRCLQARGAGRFHAVACPSTDYLPSSSSSSTTPGCQDELRESTTRRWSRRSDALRRLARNRLSATARIPPAGTRERSSSSRPCSSSAPREPARNTAASSSAPPESVRRPFGAPTDP